VEHLRHGTYHGAYLKYYETGALELEETYVDGALNCTAVEYYPNGVVKAKTVLKDNEESGPFTEYYENGVLKTEGSYFARRKRTFGRRNAERIR